MSTVTSIPTSTLNRSQPPQVNIFSLSPLFVVCTVNFVHFLFIFSFFFLSSSSFSRFFFLYSVAILCEFFFRDCQGNGVGNHIKIIRCFRYKSFCYVSRKDWLTFFLVPKARPCFLERLASPFFYSFPPPFYLPLSSSLPFYLISFRTARLLFYFYLFFNIMNVSTSLWGGYNVIFSLRVNQFFFFTHFYFYLFFYFSLFLFIAFKYTIVLFKISLLFF